MKKFAIAFTLGMGLFGMTACGSNEEAKKIEAIEFIEESYEKIDAAAEPIEDMGLLDLDREVFEGVLNEWESFYKGLDKQKGLDYDDMQELKDVEVELAEKKIERFEMTMKMLDLIEEQGIWGAALIADTEEDKIDAIDEQIDELTTISHELIHTKKEELGMNEE